MLLCYYVNQFPTDAHVTIIFNVARSSESACL